MKKTKIIIPALGILLLSTAASVTGTVAWFSANNQVTVNGMQVKTKVSSNLLIAAENAEANYSKALSQTVGALLEPVSTVDGKAFFYHSNDKIDAAGKAGDSVYTAYSESVALANTTAKKTNVDYNFNVRYGIEGTKTPKTSEGTAQEKWIGDIVDGDKSGLIAPAYGYVDYIFYIKATSSTDDSKLNLTRINLMYDDAAIPGVEKAWRVGVFKELVAKEGETNANGHDISANEMSLLSIMTLSGAGNAYTGTAVSSTSARSAVTYNATPTIDGDIDSGVTKYYKVAARLWLEGEDTTCNNETYASLTSSWKLELEFKLDTTSSPAANITSSTTIIAA